MEVADSEVSRAPVAPFSLRALRALIADPHNAEELFEARVRGRVVLLADWFTVGVVVLGVGVEDMFEQLPSLLGRQLEHCLLAFTQAQPLHEPVRLHLQHSTISLCTCQYFETTVTSRQLIQKRSNKQQTPRQPTRAPFDRYNSLVYSRQLGLPDQCPFR